MGTAIQKAIALIFSSDPELLNILSTTARLCLTSSVLALLIGLPVGIALGAGRFPGRGVLVVLNRTLMGMPPVVCGLLFYMLFSGVGPFRHLKLLFTVKLMIIASSSATWKPMWQKSPLHFGKLPGGSASAGESAFSCW